MIKILAKSYGVYILSLILLLFCFVLLSSMLGAYHISVREVVAIWTEGITPFSPDEPYSSQAEIVLNEIRLPRIIVGALVGAALGVAGVLMQGVFRNPLVEPGYLGISSGASLGAVLTLFYGWVTISPWILPLSSFMGALAAISIVMYVWKRSLQKNKTILILAGLGINLFLSAFVSVFVGNAPSEQELRSIIFWLQGGLEARTWAHVVLIVPIITIVIAITLFFAKTLNIMMLGDDHANTTGIAVDKIRNLLLVIAALLTGTAVAVSGTIGFVGLVIPHLIRLVMGSDHRILLPASALGGACFLVLADLVSRIIPGLVLQVGVVCSLIGAPVFLFLILTSRKGRL